MHNQAIKKMDVHSFEFLTAQDSRYLSLIRRVERENNHSFLVFIFDTIFFIYLKVDLKIDSFGILVLQSNVIWVNMGSNELWGGEGWVLRF